MRELDKDNLASKKQEIQSVVVKQEQQELKYLGTLKPKRGHQLWEINIATREIKLAEFTQDKPTIKWEDATKPTTVNKKKKLQIRPDCIYISALNQKSAFKRFLKGKGSSQVGR